MSKRQEGERIMFWRRPVVRAQTGESDSTTQRRIRAGLFPPGIPLGPRSVGWPAHEVEAVNAAKVRGASEDELRQLVGRLVARRKTFSLELIGALDAERVR